MANWPNYYIKVKGNANTNKKIEEILREQTIWSCLKIFTGYNFENSSMEISGATAWGIHNFDEIVKLVIENKMDLEFEQADIQADTKFYGKWINGKEIAWKESRYFDEEELAEMEALNESTETYDYEAEIENIIVELKNDIEGEK